MAGPLRYDSRDNARGRPLFSAHPPQRRSQSWASNGMHYTVDTTSWSSPGSGSNPGSGNIDRGHRTYHSTRSSVNLGGNSLLGTAFGLLDGLMGIHPHQTVMGGNFPSRGSTRRHNRLDVGSGDDGDDDNLAYETPMFNSRRERPKSIFGRIKDRLKDSKQHKREGSSSGGERTPPEQEPEEPNRRRSSYHAATREPPWTQSRTPRPEFVGVDYSDEDSSSESDFQYRNQPRRRTSTTDENEEEALEDAVATARRNVIACKMRLNLASRQNNSTTIHLQWILDDLKAHEASLAMATSQFNEARAARVRSRRAADMQPQATRSRAQQRQSTPPWSNRSQFRDPMGDHTRLSGHDRDPDPLFRTFAERREFDPFGNESPFGIPDHFFGHAAFDNLHSSFMPDTMRQHNHPHSGNQRKRQRYTMPANSHNPRPQQSQQRQQAKYPIQESTTSHPPVTLLTPNEAKRLFNVYDERWHKLTNTDPKIPYPTRGLHAEGLAARDTLWAPPHINAHVSTWSEETVMQANAHAFFLGVVGLSPQYRQNAGTGRIECGFAKTQASSTQVKALTDLLKKEKTRWHSDRLGRRNDGSGTVNEGLQKDERARAVFHAVCGLMECAQ